MAGVRPGKFKCLSIRGTQLSYTVPAEQAPVVVAAPGAISVAASTGSSSIVWLDAHGTAKKTDGVVVTENVVIVSSFLN